MESQASKENPFSRAPRTPPTPMPHSSSSLNYYTEHGLPVGYVRPDLGRAGNYIPNSSNMHGSVLRELEKKRIREQIIASERHPLEAEVRREMMMEREMALRATYPLRFPMLSSSSVMPTFNHPEDRLSHSLNFPIFSGPSTTMTNASPEPNAAGGISGLKTPPSMQAPHAHHFSAFLGPLPMMINHGLPIFNQSEGLFNRNPELEPRCLPDAEVRREMVEREMALRKAYPLDISPLSHGSDVGITELKASPEVENETIINMPNPEEGVSGLKRKAMTQQSSSNSTTPLFDPKKKLNLRLRCELCQVSATGEQQMQEHIQGRKHKSKVARQPSQTTIKEDDDLELVKEGKNNDEALLDLSSSEAINEDDDLEKVEEGKNTDVALQLSESYEDDHDDSSESLFWCEMCKFGASTEKTMDNHRMGKEHMTLRLEAIVAQGETKWTNGC